MIATTILAALSALPGVDDRVFPSMTSRPPSEEWIAMGFYDLDTDYEPADVAGDRDGTFSYCAGAWWWGDDFGTAAESQILYAHHSATVEGNSGHLDTWNVMVGARLGWRGLSNNVIAYGRGGALWRTDNGDDFTAISDDGFGVYGGLGVEFRIAGGRFSLAPDVLWTWADVKEESTQTGLGLSLVMRF